MIKAIKFILHNNYYLLVNNKFYFSLLIKIFIKNSVFEQKISY